ncbi:MAG: HupE/UreJ family protein [Bacteroidetes bacterium]|nr:HupE/UreJ family protein [Bacteroidota bacterium]MBI3481927.1 HupE/UreJ family protein [Bacteroidota bacterium]
MSEFGLYFGLGREHILDYINGYDHILFVLALCAVYLVRDWKKILILVTAFTIGHSITLALATMQIVSVKTQLIEFLIPLTIFVTACSNLFRKEENIDKKNIQINYFFALFFGLIHGMGFSNYLRALLGKSHSILSPLLAFNLGLELGQIIVVTIFLVISYILVDWLKVSRRDWKMVLSSAIGGIAFILMKDRMIF